MQPIEDDIEGESPPCEELPVEPAFTHFTSVDYFGI